MSCEASARWRRAFKSVFLLMELTILAFSDPHIHILLLFALELEHVVVDIMQEVYKSSNSFIDFH